MKNTTNKIEGLSNAILRNTKSELRKTLEVLDLEFDDLYSLIEKLTNKEKDEVITTVINKQLEELTSTITLKQYEEVTRNVDEVTDYFTSKKESFDAVIEEADTVANDLLFKALGHNGRNLDLPLDISCIKKYCFSTEIKKEQLYEALLWIIIRYSAIIECIGWQDYLKNLKENQKKSCSSM